MVASGGPDHGKKQENRAHHRHHRPGWFVFNRAAPGKRLHGPWRRPPNEQSSSFSHRAFAPRSKYLRQVALSSLRGSFRWHDAPEDFFPGTTGRALLSGGSKPRRVEFRDPRVHLRRSGDGDLASPRNCARPAAPAKILSRLQLRNFRERDGIAADGKHGPAS